MSENSELPQAPGDNKESPHMLQQRGHGEEKVIQYSEFVLASAQSELLVPQLRW